MGFGNTFDNKKIIGIRGANNVPTVNYNLEPFDYSALGGLFAETFTEYTVFTGNNLQVDCI